MNGVVITESGLIAAAHLVRIGGIKRASESGDLDSQADGFNAKAKEYMELFGGFDVHI